MVERKVMERLPKEIEDVASAADMPPREIEWEIKQGGESGRVGQRRVVALYQGRWFGYSETMK